MELSKTELKRALVAERTLLIDLVEHATKEQLRQPSLCTGWSNQNVLGHILGFELSRTDSFLLLFRLRELNDINEKQAQKYANLPNEEYVRLLRRGLKRTLHILQFIPGKLLNKKFIPVPNGHLSPAQLMGDLAMDRAIHYLDIAAPLKVAKVVDEPAAMHVAVKFVLSCIDLLNPKIPRKFYGQVIELKLTGLCGGTYYWKIGSDEVSTAIDPTEKPVLTAQGDTNDFLFTVSVRSSLLKQPMAVAGNKELEEILRRSFNANALWEH